MSPTGLERELLQIEHDAVAAEVARYHEACRLYDLVNDELTAMQEGVDRLGLLARDGAPKRT